MSKKYKQPATQNDIPQGIDPTALPAEKLQKDYEALIQAEQSKKAGSRTNAVMVKTAKSSIAPPSGTFGHISNPFRDSTVETESQQSTLPHPQ